MADVLLRCWTRGALWDVGEDFGWFATEAWMISSCNSFAERSRNQPLIYEQSEARRLRDEAHTDTESTPEDVK
jgi:hypothetical protein